MPITKNINSRPTYNFVEQLLKNVALAKAHVLNLNINDLKKLELYELCDKIKAREKAQHKITETPSVEMLKRMALKQEEIDEFEQKLLIEADNYNIKINVDNPDFFSLEEQIIEWRYLLNKAKSLGISWDSSSYDPMWLEQEIRSVEEKSETYRPKVIMDTTLL